MKKTTAIILAAGLVLSSLAGCSSGSGSKSQEDTTAKTDDKKTDEEKTVIKFWTHSNEPWVKAYKETATRFEEKFPQYKVEITDYPFNDYIQKMQTSLMSGSEGADVYAIWGGMAPDFITTGALSKVPDELVKELDSDYFAPTTGIYKYKGTYYGVPLEYNLEYGGMVVNKKLFDQANLSYPKTWDELRTVSKQVAKKNGDIMEMRGFDAIDRDALICNYLAMILQQGGKFMDENYKINFATPEGIKAMEELVSMVKDGETDLAAFTDNVQTFNYVYEDKSYMGSVGSWAIGEGTDTYSLKYGEDFEYVQVPQYGSEMAFASESGWGMIVPEKTKVKEGAWEFVKFVSEPENLAKHNIACSQLPPRKSMVNNEEYRKAKPQVSFLLDNLDKGVWMGPYNTSDMRDVFDAMFNKLCTGESTDIEAALKECSETISATVLDYK